MQIKSISRAIATLQAADVPEAYVHASRLMLCVHEAIGAVRLCSLPNSQDAVFVKKLLKVGQVPAVLSSSCCTAACLMSCADQQNAVGRNMQTLLVVVCDRHAGRVRHQ